MFLVIQHDVLKNLLYIFSVLRLENIILFEKFIFSNYILIQASSEEGAKKVYLLLQNKTSWSVGWHTLFTSLNVYEQHFKQSLQTTGALLPPFPEGDAKALEAYLQVLKKVV
jgi:nuclear pore complex protein Nup205